MKDRDNKNNVSHDLIGEATRAKHIMNIVECEDAHGNTPLSEASSKLTYQGWQVCDEAVITAGKNTVITGSSQTTRVVTNCHKLSQTQK